MESRPSTGRGGGANAADSNLLESGATFGYTGLMMNETIKTYAHTTQDGMLNLSVEVGVADIDVAVVIHVSPAAPAAETDPNGWPKEFFERVAGSIPDLQRPPQGQFENRLTLE